jgi:erythromycin esterase-like protein
LRRRLEAFDPEARRFVRWATANAIQLDPDRPESLAPERFAALDALLAGKRIVYLAESDHFLHETYVFRRLLLPYLFSRGWRWIGEEIGASDGSRIDAYLATGDERVLDRVATFGYRGAGRTDRDDSATGLLREGAPVYPHAGMKSEQRSLLRAVRELDAGAATGASRPRFFGFDIDAIVGGAYEDLAQLLGTHPEDATLREVFARLERVCGESRRDEIARIEGVLALVRKRRASLEALLGADEYDSTVTVLASLRDSLEFVADAFPATDWRVVSDAMARREEAMLRRVRHVLSRLGAGEKLVLQGHAGHLCKRWPAVRPLEMWAGPPPLNLGTALAEEHGDEVFSIWMIHGHGRSAQPFSTLPAELSILPGTLNAVLAEVGSCFLLPVTSGATLLRRERDISWMYNAIIRTRLADQADAVFFVREVGPLRGE